MTEKITYAKAGGPPNNWRGLRIFDCTTGIEVKEVFEVDCAAGWLTRLCRDANGQFVLTEDRQDIKTERIEGRFRIELPAHAPDREL